MKLPIESIKRIAEFQQFSELTILATTCTKVREEIYNPHVLIIYCLTVFDKYDKLTEDTIKSVGIKNCVLSKKSFNIAIATIPDSLASRITHIVGTVTHGYDYNTNGPKELLPDGYNRFTLGQKFINLNTLELDYPAAGHVCREIVSPLASLLIIFLDWTKITLEKLILRIRKRIEIEDMCLILTEFDITSITIYDNPWSFSFNLNRSERENQIREERRRYLDHVKETGEWEPTELFPSLIDLYCVRALRDCGCI